MDFDLIFKKRVQENPEWIESGNVNTSLCKYPEFRKWCEDNKIPMTEVKRLWDKEHYIYLNPLPNVYADVTKDIEISDDVEDYPEDEEIELPTAKIEEVDITEGQGKEIYEYLKEAKMDGRFKNTFRVACTHNPYSLVEWIHNNGYDYRLVERIFDLIDKELKINGYEDF